MHTIFNKFKLAGIFLLFLLLTAAAKPEPAKAAEKLELNKSYTIEIGNDDLLYEFSVPEAGNIHIQIKNSNPAGGEIIAAQLFDSNNLAITNSSRGSNVEFPVYSTDGNRTFYLKVYNYSGAFGKAFQLTAGFEPTADWETEPNDTSDSADMITSGIPWYGAVTESSDKCDYFKFKLDSSKKIEITFGPKEVSGINHIWSAYLINDNNQSVQIYHGSDTQTYTCYLKKGTYFINIKNYSGAVNVPYKLLCKESQIKLDKPNITSVKADGYESAFSSYVEISRIKIKNSGDATGYKVKVSNKKNMGGKAVTEEIDFDETNTKKQIALKSRFEVSRAYYIQAQSYVTDPFGMKIYGKYGSVKCKNLKKSVYDKMK